MFHLAAYLNTALGTGANTDTPALQDDILFIQNNHFVAPRDLYLWGAHVESATMLRARLRSPKINQIAPNYIRPVQTGLLPANNPNIDYRVNQPLKLNGAEEISLELTASPATTEPAYGILWLSDKMTPDVINSGEIYRTRVTSTTTSGVRLWTTLAMVYEQQVIAGTYNVVGAFLQSTNGVAFRLIFDMQPFRPGGLMESALGNRLPYYEHDYPFGVWGQFKTVSLPRWQVLTNAADSAFEGYLYFQRIGA